MKRILLTATLFTSCATFAQFTQTNEPAIGDSHTYFVVDTLAPNYATVTGTGVTWDYSGTGSLTEGGMAATTDMTIVDPSTTADGASFTSATKAIEIDGYMTSYFTSSASSRNSKGFVFDGNVIVLNDANDEILMNYPFAVGGNLTDNFTGTAQTQFGDIPATGNVSAAVDGSGTLKLTAAISLTGVVRYKLVETATASTPFGAITMTRTQYEYYHFVTGNLPVFVHSKTDVTIGGGAPNSQTVVLNYVDPDGFLSIDEDVLAGVSVYPNPVNDMLYVNGLEDAATLTLVDAQGKTMNTLSATAGTASVNVSDLNSGVYFLKIATEKGSKIERVVVR